jgi:stearoyl-CoA desaturase (delta-9 desaturase)
MKNVLRALIRWFDSDYSTPTQIHYPTHYYKIDWLRCAPFIAMHGMCLFVFTVGWSPVALATAIILYAIRIFAITGIYHRYFSHKTYETSRLVQFLFGILGASAVQRGPLWWAAHHRHHHLYSDRPEDVHSPKQHGFWWAHMGWIMSRKNFATDYKRIPDFAKYPELLFLNRFDILVPTLLGVSLFFFGTALKTYYPQLGTSGFQMLVWGFFVSTVVLFHATATINSLAHLIGKPRFNTGDDSKNSLLLALLTFGEGWHNNHHRYQAAARQGFYWYEIDLTYYTLKVLSWIGLIWKLRPVPERILQTAMEPSQENLDPPVEIKPPIEPALES